MVTENKDMQSTPKINDTEYFSINTWSFLQGVAEI